MYWKDTTTGYGLVTRLLHWGMALAIVAMFVLGVWMRTLDYYSPYYELAPYIHQAAGILLLASLIARFAPRSLRARRPTDPCHRSRV